MVKHYSLNELRFVPFKNGDSISARFVPKVNKRNAENLHGISYSGIFLKPKSYNSTVIEFIDSILEPSESFDFRTACEVKTRIYVRDELGKWKSVPKRKFWKEQCHILWELWKNFVNYARPRRAGWGDRLVFQIDARRKDGEFRYNPLLSARSRRKLREIYTEHVFNRELYNEEKGKPGRPRKVREQPVRSAPDRTAFETKSQTATAQILTV